MNKDSRNLATAVQRMLANGMSQYQVAAKLDISQSTVSRLAQFRPEHESGSLAEMIADEGARRVIRDQIYEAYHSGDIETVAELDRELRSI